MSGGEDELDGCITSGPGCIEGFWPSFGLVMRERQHGFPGSSIENDQYGTFEQG